MISKRLLHKFFLSFTLVSWTYYVSKFTIDLVYQNMERDPHVQKMSQSVSDSLSDMPS